MFVKHVVNDNDTNDKRTCGLEDEPDDGNNIAVVVVVHNSIGTTQRENEIATQV